MSRVYSGGYAGRIAHHKGGESGYTLECEEDEFLPDSYVPRHARAGSREEEAHREDETFEERQFMEQQWALPPAGEYRARTLLRDRRGDVINPWKELKVGPSREGSAHLPVELGGLGLPLSPSSAVKAQNSTQKAAPDKDPSDGIGSNPGSESAVNIDHNRGGRTGNMSSRDKPSQIFRIRHNPGERSVDDQRTAEVSEYFPEHDFSLDGDEPGTYEPRSKHFLPGPAKIQQNEGYHQTKVPRQHQNSDNKPRQDDHQSYQIKSPPRRPEKPNWYHDEATFEDAPPRKKKQTGLPKIGNPELLPVAGKVSQSHNQRTPVHEFKPEDIRLPHASSKDSDNPKRRNMDISREDPSAVRDRLQQKYRENVHSNLTGKDMLGVFKYLPEVLEDETRPRRHKDRAVSEHFRSRTDGSQGAQHTFGPAGVRPPGEKLSLVQPYDDGEAFGHRDRPKMPEFVPKYQHVKNYREKMHNSVIRDIFTLPGSAAQLSAAERKNYHKIGERLAHSVEVSDSRTGSGVRTTPAELSTKKPTQVQQGRGVVRSGYKSSGLGSAETEVSGPSKRVENGATNVQREEGNKRSDRMQRIGVGLVKEAGRQIQNRVLLAETPAGMRKKISLDCVSDLVGSGTLKPTKLVEQTRLRSPVSRKSDKVRFETEINQNGRSYSGATVITRPEPGQSNSQSHNQRSVTSGIRGQQAFNVDQVKISHLVEQSTSVLAKYLHRVDGISELTGCLRKEVGLLGLGKKGPHLQSAVQKIVKHEDFDVALHRVYGPSKRKVEKVKKSIWRRIILLSNGDRKAKLKMLLSETSPSYPKS